MSSGFVPSGTLAPDDNSVDRPAPAEDSWTRAEKAIEYAKWQQEEASANKHNKNEEKSLYEILQANKARKQEEFEEKLKFKNQFKPLDEDDVEFLDTIMSEQARTEMLRKRELAAQLSEFRRAQYETEAAATGALEKNIPSVEDVVVGGWSTSGRKRKKGDKAGVAGVPKFRKLSSTGSAGKGDEKNDKADVKLKAESVSKTNTATVSLDATASPADSTKKAATGDAEKEEKSVAGKSPKQAEVKTSPTSATTQRSPSGVAAVADKPKSAGGGLLGLVAYSSDDDDE